MFLYYIWTLSVFYDVTIKCEYSRFHFILRKNVATSYKVKEGWKGELMESVDVNLNVKWWIFSAFLLNGKNAPIARTLTPSVCVWQKTSKRVVRDQKFFLVNVQSLRSSYKTTLNLSSKKGMNLYQCCNWSLTF